MAMLLKTNDYTIMMGADDYVFIRSKRRYMRFKSIHKLYKYASEYKGRDNWMIEFLPDRRQELIQDGIDAAMNDFVVWYDTRKSRAKIHMRMVGKLLVWHHQSVRKLWDPSRPENYERLMEVYHS